MIEIPSRLLERKYIYQSNLTQPIMSVEVKPSVTLSAIYEITAEMKDWCSKNNIIIVGKDKSILENCQYSADWRALPRETKTVFKRFFIEGSDDNIILAKLRFGF